MDIKDSMARTLSSWMKVEGPNGDIVLGTRVRLARNVVGIPFPATAKKEQLRHLLDISEGLVSELSSVEKFTFLKMAEVDSLERQLLVEKHLISPSHIHNTSTKGLLLGENEDTSIMINEEDHFRIQVLFPGLQLESAWRKANKVDDVIEEKVDYAFDMERGFLTACPTNVGTAMRASVMVHLPALTRVNQLKRMLTTITQFGLVVRGLYGEGSESSGNIYQISNQVTLGHSEEEIIDHLQRITSQVLTGERKAREYLLESERRLQIEDMVHRSFGILTNARIITSKEAMSLLSDVRLGIDLGLIKDLDKDILKQLMVLIRQAHLQKFMGQNLPSEERDRLRAALIRGKLLNK
ncbi:MAG: protein arginine kinase [Firmicutes bacterium]|nr:protein arginine kinase [Bacillota bacterium]